MARLLIQLCASVMLIACIGCVSVSSDFEKHGKYGVACREIEISEVPAVVIEAFNDGRKNRPYRTIVKHGESLPHLYEFYTVEGDGMTSECYTDEGRKNGGVL